MIVKIMGSDQPRIGSTENIESSISLSSLITPEETEEEQQALDTYLNTAMTDEQAHNLNTPTLEDSGTSSEILQQLTQNNQVDSSHLV